jgi:predicted DNA-binding transcriptional regulator AlpA
MNEPERLLQMPQLARRLGVFYSVVYKAFTCGELSADFALLNGSPLWKESNVGRALECLKKRLSAEDFQEAQRRLPFRQAESEGRCIDRIDERRPISVIEPGGAGRVLSLGDALAPPPSVTSETGE